MKRLAFRSIAFVATLGIGISTIWIFLGQPRTLGERDANRDRSIAVNAMAPVLETKPKIDTFVPEFRELPNFDDIEYKAPPGKLIEILDEGLYRQSEVVAKNGEDWLVFVKVNSKYSLKRSAASVKKLRGSSWPGDELDARLAFKVAGKPIIAIKGLHNLKLGEIPTLFQAGLNEQDSEGEPIDEEIADGYRREFVLNHQTYILRASKGITLDGTKVAVLVVESNGVSQIVKQVYHAPTDDHDIIGSLLWVGDLDRDGKLDLYFDEFNEKGYTSTELHLSSYAEPRKLVGLAAGFGMAGC